MIGVFSKGILRIPYLDAFLGQPVQACDRRTPVTGLSAIAGWGMRPSTRHARNCALRHGLPFLALEDGFLRSYAPGPTMPPLSMVVDLEGIYYDASRPGALALMLASDRDLLAGREDEVRRARELILAHRLSKYNHAPDAPAGRLGDGQAAVLVVDQTRGDMGVRQAGGSPEVFEAMLRAAIRENPGSRVYVKTHPEVSGGRKTGYLGAIDADVTVLREDLNPLSLMPLVDRVYVVSSHMGFEALLAGKPVTCFGTPWYSGWGVTDDRRPAPPRGRSRSVEELFAAAYFDYTRYLNPHTHERGTIFDVIEWLARQRELAARERGRSIAVGFRRWKAANVRPLLGLDASRVRFVRNAGEARALQPGPQDRLIVWGADPAPELASLARSSSARLVRMEDGFLRSVGLGSDFVPPLSLVLDEQGLYFDPRQPSALESLLNTRVFSEDDLARARRVRQAIVDQGLTKYNIEPRRMPDWDGGGRKVVLVPGQVEDDASILSGCTTVATNLALLREARMAEPQAYIVYKPHPDVMVKNRAGRVRLEEAAQWADRVETRCSVVSCIEAADAVHTMTSLSGFEALLRGKSVTVYGAPFYAGWGLTRDLQPLPRRKRRLQLDELVAGALLHYPLYWDWTFQGYTRCESAIGQLAQARERTPTPPRATGRLLRKVRMYLMGDFRLQG
ncbi:capsular polysaccharide biosynthesis protein [Bordetella hinzii]|uniref:Beta-3-deoxy-D-manno-oct-2-ulosonic acid transferase n=1 Tax=Bordetella hinzii TaxID=103855 RepID=A0AAN1RWK4_9BORD|nr:capsular polysaccharide biosynthesis protein [Bordetella hinzii]AKQ61662.1 Capsule polysaccharide biosynthesis protein [Bordetella hinzii]AZW17388.1 beta-3-deoxy-D-manno-oct-2-ulosonic acid transferase [Bordetella hinzii]MBZ0076627.1 capsular polysaccharide biosynthesis protein [Bordetella hinzii]MBZ0080086.1 capsular polysaccharide biosynthesis protein [Bordetella hinzii]MBZ0084553.1 capsular polysaccharide biosynthesis protein [Bordetella hinzii]